MTIMQQNHQGEIMGLENETLDLRGVPSALEAITRAEIDVQISTAKRYPRSSDRFLKEAINMVSLNQQLAEKCTYALPRRAYNKLTKEWETKLIEGPSVRLAEIVAVCWGNIKIAGRIVDDDGKTLTGQGIGHDLERNVCYALEGKRSIVSSNGQRYTDDMVVMNGNALVATITRNVTFKCVPRAFVAIIHERAQEIARGDEKTLFERLNAAIGWLAKKGVKEPEIYRVLEVNGKADVTLDDLMTLKGFCTSITEGLATPQEIFAAPVEPKVEKATVEAGSTKTQNVSAKLGEMFPGESPVVEPKVEKTKKAETKATKVPDGAGDAWEPPA